MSSAQPDLAIPYPGLRPFDEADHLLFFGRNEQTNELLMRLEDSAFVAVVGSSGSGKSSLVRAGLLPLLRDGFLFGTDNWKIAVARPVDEPYQRLAHKLTVFRDDVTEAEVLRLLRCSDDGLIQAVDAVCDDSEAHVLVVIDQFEELFGFRRAGDSQRQLQNCASRDEAAAFVAMLLAAARKGGDRLRIMITMRSDFVGDCEVFLGLPQAVSQSQFLVPRLTRSQMEEAITGPSQIRHAGFETFDFEQGLITTLTNDAGDRPDQLPLLQHALMRTWKLSNKKYLTAADYTKAGRIEKALSNDADGAWESLNDDYKQLARQMFLLLCEVSQEGQMTRRRPRAQEVMDVAQVGCADIERVVRVFQAKDRNFLLPPSPETILPTTLLDISHESLLRQWDRLRDWLEAEEKSAEEYLRLADRARLWTSNDDLLRGRELERAQEWRQSRNPTAAWAKRYHPEFAKTIEYVENSRKIEEEKARSARNKQRNFRAIVAATFVFLVGVTFWAFFERGNALSLEASANKEKANALWQAGIAGRAEGRSLSATYRFLLAAQTSSDKTQQRYIELAAQSTMAGLIRSFPHDDVVGNAIYNNDQSRVLSWDKKGAMKLWDMDPTKAETLREWKNVDDQAMAIAVSDAIFSPDGSHVLSWDQKGAMKLWDMDPTKAKTLREWKNVDDQAMAIAVSGAIFSPDGLRVLFWDGTSAVKLWDIKEPKPSQSWKHNAPVSGAQFSPDDGSRFLSWDATGAVKLWDTKAAKPSRSWKHDVAVLHAAFAGGPFVLSWSDDNVMKMWNVKKDKSVAEFKGVPAPSFASISSGGISKDGRLRISEITRKKVVELWNPDQESPRRQWEPDTSVSDAIFTRDGSRVFTWSDNGALKLWDTNLALAESDNGIISPTWSGETGDVSGAMISPDGSGLLTWSDNDELKLWDTNAAGPPRDLKTDTFILGAIFTPDGSGVLTWDYNGTLKLWDTNPAAAGPLNKWGNVDADNEPVAVTGAIFTPDGSEFLIWDYNGTLKLWDMKEDGPPKEWKRDTKITGAIFTPDGSEFLTWDGVGAVKLWDANKGDSRGGKKAEPLRVWKHDKSITGAIFTHDGLRILSWSIDGVMKMWPLDRGGSIKEWKHAPPVDSAQFTKNGASILTWTNSAAMQLKSWDAALRDEGLTPAQRILELQVRSATQLTKAGELVPLSIEEWTKKTAEYEKIKPKQQKK